MRLCAQTTSIAAFVTRAQPCEAAKAGALAVPCIAMPWRGLNDDG